MTKIRTAEEMINSTAFSKLMSSDKDRVKLIMQEYAKQFIDLATDAFKDSPNDEEFIRDIKNQIK